MDKKVAFVRFKEVGARFVDDSNGKMLSKAMASKDYWLLKHFFVTIASQKSTLDDSIVSNKLINNSLIDHQVLASLRNSVRFQMSDDCKGIQRHDIYGAG